MVLVIIFSITQLNDLNILFTILYTTPSQSKYEFLLENLPIIKNDDEPNGNVGGKKLKKLNPLCLLASILVSSKAKNIFGSIDY